jgi:hypothetical protein
MREKTPQEKKRLSLQKDRRNVYGEAPHATRKSIPLRKKLRNRANRHQQESQLPAGPLCVGAGAADEIESGMRRRTPQIWKKSPDAPLGEVIAKKQWRRATPKKDRIRIITQQGS